MAMQIPNPFSTEIRPMGGEGLATPSTSAGWMKQQTAAFEKSQESLASWQDEQDKLSARKAINDYKQACDDAENDPKAGFKTLLGMNAIKAEDGSDAMDRYRTSLKDRRAEICKSLGSDRARAMFNEYADSQDLYTNRAINRHVIAQQGVVDKNETERSVNTLLTTIQSSKDPVEIQGSLMAVRMINENQYIKNGLTPDLTTVYGPAIGITVGRAIDAKRTGEARRILEANKEYFKHDQYAKLDALIKRANEANVFDGEVASLIKGYQQTDTSAEKARRIISSIVGGDVSQADVDRALKLAGGKIEDAAGIIYAGTTDALEKKTDLTQDQKDRTARGRSLYTDISSVKRMPNANDVAAEMLAKNPKANPKAIMAAARKVADLERAKIIEDQQNRDKATTAAALAIERGGSVSDIPATVMADLPSETVESLKEYEARRRGGTLVTDSATYEALSDDATLKGMSEESFQRTRVMLSPEDFDLFQRRRVGLLTGRIQNPKQEQIREAFKDSLVRFGLGEPKDKDDKAAYGLVKRELERKLMRDSRFIHGTMTDAEVQDFVERAMKATFNVPVSGLLFGESKRHAPMLKILNGDVKVFNGTKLADLLDVSLNSRGIASPTPEIRKELALEICFYQHKAIPGADAMAQWILKNDRRQLETQLKQSRRGSQTLDSLAPSEIVRAYFILNGWLTPSTFGESTPVDTKNANSENANSGDLIDG